MELGICLPKHRCIVITTQLVRMSGVCVVGGGGDVCDRVKVCGLMCIFVCFHAL